MTATLSQKVTKWVNLSEKAKDDMSMSKRGKCVKLSQKVKDGYHRVRISKGDEGLLVCAISLKVTKRDDKR
jgi:hypothetical protein